MNKRIPLLLSLGILCCGSSQLLAQETPILPDTLPLPKPSPETPTPSAPPVTPLDINPFRLPSGIDPQADTAVILTPSRFIFQGNTLFTDEQLQVVVSEYIGKPISVGELFQLEEAITQLYVSEGYLNSGAIVADTGAEIDPSNAEITLQIIEGKVSEIEISGAKRLENYVRARVNPVTKGVLREQKIQETLRWLQIDPLVEGLNVQLRPSQNAGQAILALAVEPAKPLAVEVFANNNRSPSVGTFERGATAAYRNVTGLGDIFSLTYRNTTGSNVISGNYAVPVNAKNGTLSVSFTYGDNDITEEPFNLIDLNTNAIQYELSYRQPIYRKISGDLIQEFALGVSLSRLENDESILGVPFPLTEGADETGQTNSTVLRLIQEFANRDQNDSLIIRSQFNFGLPIATRNAELFGNGTSFAWRGQTLWAHQFSKFTWVNRAGVQFADGPLIPSEQFSLGGVSTVRGFRQDGITRDSGLFVSSELRVPLISGDSGTLQIVPFIDIGHAFNQGDRFLPNQSQTLASVGLGLRYDLGDSLSARIDYGIPLLNRSERRPTVQEEGLHLSVSWRF
ncbi:ShlB/FhaC/HecB family hemolysin secretion/activation protein (plasmid) [Acaryochloris sp. 'Moss Beach']|uniref:ShlB/FhaC/HecB family hemolysin secretion/activation protein n=1 Tax=Acaryochloris sp. 'Moss Beach' TaxID=2740837 RepID=UPI001F428EF1|nr:ShlB/FhaC/HecB family hemolysin secretion/activation protein [Acaryochloris sp. 'Moss Beach']UJB73077.1 ShlB/FhaC/HecB family hemolysin secretion/activation protein [Acaryochloris sp. 'Moss Beach']